MYIGRCPSWGDTDSILGAAPHEGLLTLYLELPLTKGYWLYIGSFPSRGATHSILGAAPHEGLLTLYWELPLMITRGYRLYIGSCPSRGATDSIFGTVQIANSSPNTYTVSHTNPESIYTPHLFGCYGNRLVSTAPVSLFSLQLNHGPSNILVYTIWS